MVFLLTIALGFDFEVQFRIRGLWKGKGVTYNLLFSPVFLLTIALGFDFKVQFKV